MKLKQLSIIAASIAMLSACPLNAFADDEDSAAPVGIPEDERVVIFESDFEDQNVGKWVPFGGSASLSITDSSAHGGDYSLIASDRQQTFNGPSITCDSFMAPGDIYYFDGWIYHDSGSEKDFSWVIKYNDFMGETHYVGINTISLASGEWSYIGGSAELPDDANDIGFYFECSNAAAEFLIDDVVVKGRTIMDSSANKSDLDKKGVIKSFDFERGKEGWNTRGGERLLPNDAAAHTGSYSLYSSNREKTWNGPSVGIGDIIDRDKEYFYSAYIMYNGDEYEASHKFRLEIEYSLEGSANYMLISDKVIEKGKWTEISGFYTIPGGAENVRLYLQTDNNDDGVDPTINDLMSFYVDTVTISDGAYVRKQAKIQMIIKIVVAVAVLAIIGVIAFLAFKKMKKNKQTLEAAEKDAMTHALNRNTYEKRLSALRDDPEKCKSLYFALCDVNFLKYINDNFGHKCGDDAISRCAKLLINAVGSDGDVYRTGGDEFVCISDKPLKDKITEALNAESDNEKEYPFAVACGFDSYDSNTDGEKPEVSKIIARCDKHMYEQKQKIKAENKEFSRK